MKLVGLVMVSMIVPWTHKVCPTSATVMDKVSRQLDSDVRASVTVAVNGIWLGDVMTSAIAVFVGRMVDIFVGVLLGFMGVSEAGICVDFICWV